MLKTVNQEKIILNYIVPISLTGWYAEYVESSYPILKREITGYNLTVTTKKLYWSLNVRKENL